MRGWFDAFRTEGGPTLYAYSNRTSVTGDLSIITTLLVFLTIFLAFLTIFPGVRKERFSTLCTVTLSLFTGTVICMCNLASDWHVARGVITSSYRAFSKEKIHASMGVSIGLDHANVTLRVIPQDNRTLDINFNERFYWDKPNDLKMQYKAALVKGLPYPILTVSEYLSLDSEGFAWGRYYRSAGYYSSIVLWSAFASWILMNILLLNVPRYGAYMMTVTGFLMALTNFVYWCLIPRKPLLLRFEDAELVFDFGWCFWIVLVTGATVGLSGIIIFVMDWMYPHKFSTILEVDFDTPYDRHIIIEDSHDQRKRRFKIPKVEEPFIAGLTAGSRLLRRLSKRGKDNQDENETRIGIDNMGFEMEPPKSPLRNIMNRSDSKKSTKSVNFRSMSQRSHQFLDIPQLSYEDKPAGHLQRSDSKQSNLSATSLSSSPRSVVFDENQVVSSPVPPMDRQDSSQSCASTSSSFGLGMLSRGSSVRKNSGEENLHEEVARNNSSNIIVFHRTDSRGQLQKLPSETVEIHCDDASMW